MTKITVNFQEYVVEIERTSEDMGQNTRKAWVQAGIIADLIIRKPRGKHLFSVSQYVNGNFGQVVDLQTTI